MMEKQQSHHIFHDQMVEHVIGARFGMEKLPGSSLFQYHAMKEKNFGVMVSGFQHKGHFVWPMKEKNGMIFLRISIKELI